jgi:hypothetical protein
MKAFPNNRSEGMDLRDYFAAHATENDIAEYLVDHSTKSWITYGTGRDAKMVQKTPSKIRTRLEAKYAYADAMMEERNAEKKED